MSIFDDRWNAVHELFMAKIIPWFDVPGIDVLYHGIKINRDQLKIGDRTIDVIDGNTTFCIWDGDLRYDHGAYDQIEVTETRILNDFKVYKNLLIG